MKAVTSILGILLFLAIFFLSAEYVKSNDYNTYSNYSKYTSSDSGTSYEDNSSSTEEDTYGDAKFSTFIAPVKMYDYSLTKRPAKHRAIDIRAPIGTPIYACRAGEVSLSKYLGAYGLVVFLDHSGGYQTRYAHLKKIEVKLGKSVNKGDLIGYVGLTGRTTGPHLHFEILKGDYNYQTDRYDYKRYSAEEVIKLISLTNWEWSYYSRKKK